MIEGFWIDGMPIQDMINADINCCDNKNAKARNETINILSTIYKHLSEVIRIFLKDTKDSTLSFINAKFW